jgi:hypothetical protein
VFGSTSEGSSNGAAYRASRSVHDSHLVLELHRQPLEQGAINAQAEIAGLRRQLDVAQRRLARTEAALLIMGKAQALLEDLYESADTEPTSTGS